MQTRGNRAIVEDLLLWSLKDASLATIVSVSVYEEPSSVPSETKGLPGSEGKKKNKDLKPNSHRHQGHH